MSFISNENHELLRSLLVLKAQSKGWKELMNQCPAGLLYLPGNKCVLSALKSECNPWLIIAL